jgi:hypothetical protein
MDNYPITEDLNAPAPPSATAPANGPLTTTRVLLWFADGTTPPVQGPPCVGKAPPAFRCEFGRSTEDCKREILDYLDRWYAEFNVEFTLDGSAGVHQTVIVSSSGAWCGQPAHVGGLAPALCEPLIGATAYAFQCGGDAKTCASIIAQEHAHTIGLVHTKSPADVMYPVIGPESDGFEAHENVVQDVDCRKIQDSHALMRARLGLWEQGAKPPTMPGAP